MGLHEVVLMQADIAFLDIFEKRRMRDAELRRGRYCRDVRLCDRRPFQPDFPRQNRLRPQSIQKYAIPIKKVFSPWKLIASIFIAYEQDKTLRNTAPLSSVKSFFGDNFVLSRKDP